MYLFNVESDEEQLDDDKIGLDVVDGGDDVVVVDYKGDDEKQTSIDWEVDKAGSRAAVEVAVVVGVKNIVRIVEGGDKEQQGNLDDMNSDSFDVDADEGYIRRIEKSRQQKLKLEEYFEDPVGAGSKNGYQKKQRQKTTYNGGKD